MAFLKNFFGKSEKSAAVPETVSKQEASHPTQAVPPVPVSAPAPAPTAPHQALEFGSWLAIKGSSKEKIVEVLGMSQTVPCQWAEGLRQSTGRSSYLFVTDPVEGCNLVIGTALPGLAYRAKALSWVTDLSGNFPGVYAFEAQKNVQVYAFAQAEEGALYRIYAVAQGAVRVNKGDISDAEEALNLKLPENDDELFDGVGVTLPSEEVIRALAAHWTVDPQKAHGLGGIFGLVERI